MQEVLEAAGLVRVQRRCDQNPLVTVLRGAAEWYVLPANAFREEAAQMSCMCAPVRICRRTVWGWGQCVVTVE